MQSASETPSSHLRAQSCPADQRGVGCGCDRRANPGTEGRRPARVPAARDRPAGNHERRRDSPPYWETCFYQGGLDDGAGVITADIEMAAAPAPSELIPGRCWLLSTNRVGPLRD